MSKIKQSLAWWCFQRGSVTADELIEQAARIGYAGVEMCPQEHWGKVRDAGLRVITEGGHGTLTDGLNRRANHDRIAGEIDAKLALAVKWEIPCLIVFSGNCGGLSEQEGLDATVEGLRRVAPAAESAGVTLVLELLNSRVDHPDYQCDRTDWGVAVCKEVDSPRVKLLYDIYHMQIMEGDVIRTIRDNIAHIGHFHTAGNPGRHELDDSQELFYPAIMRAIAGCGFDGYVGQELVPKGDPMAALQQAYGVCDA